MEKEELYDTIAGSLVGGAAGDALGYAIEFNSIGQILSYFGPGGINHYKLSRGVAQISDDTQMTLFTADALAGCGDGLYDASTALSRIKEAYLAWFRTQGGVCVTAPHSGLEDIAALHSRRAPGNTCMQALYELGHGLKVYNDSKGCGGAMRVAPVALYALSHPEMSAKDVALLAGEAARITHRHPLGYISAAYIATLIYLCASNKGKGQSAGELLNKYAVEAIDVINDCYRSTCRQDCDYMALLAKRAIEESKLERDDIDSIDSLGQGWVGEEAVAIALYCALKHSDDFSAALRASVNHSGDSDSTGAICGNLLGAVIGYEAIAYEWKQDLELHDLILETAHRLTEE